MKTLNASSRFWTTAGVFAGSVFLAGLSQVAVHRTVAQWLVLLYRCYTIPGSNPGWTKVFLCWVCMFSLRLCSLQVLWFPSTGQESACLRLKVWIAESDPLLVTCPECITCFCIIAPFPLHNSTVPFSMNHHCSTSAQNCHVAVNITHVGHRGEILSY